MRNWLKIRSEKTKKLPFWQNGKITFSRFHRYGKHILCSCLNCSLQWKTSLYRTVPLIWPQKSILSPPEGANFRLEVHDFYLKGNYWLFKVCKLFSLLEMTSSNSCIFVRKQLLYSNCHKKKKVSKTQIHEVFGHNPKFLHNGLLISGVLHNMVSYLA